MAVTIKERAWPWTFVEWRRLTPMENPATAKWDVPLKYEEYVYLLRGFRSIDSDGKWNISADIPDAEGNTTVRFTRSWTGREQIALGVVAGDPNNTDVDAWARIVSIAWEKREGSVGYLSSEADAKATTMNLYNALIVDQQSMRGYGDSDIARNRVRWMGWTNDLAETKGKMKEVS